MTAVSTEMWSDFLLFYSSLRDYYNGTLYIINLGLEPHEVQHLKSLSAIVIEINHNKYPKLANWQKWFKPYYISLIRPVVDYLLWIDVDTVVLGYLDPLFAAIYDDFLVMADHFAPQSCLNHPSLYDTTRSLFECPVTDCRPLNSGVVGFAFPRDDYILHEWLTSLEFVIKNPSVRQYIRLFDQGLLLWVMNRLNKTKFDYPITWNYPAPRNIYSNNYECELRYHCPANTIIAHFAGAPKLHELMGINHPNVMKYRENKRKSKTVRYIVFGLTKQGIHTLYKLLSKSLSCYIEHVVNFNDSVLDRLKRDDCDLVFMWGRALIDHYNELATIPDLHFIIVVCDHNIGLMHSKIFEYEIYASAPQLYPYCAQTYLNDEYGTIPYTEVPQTDLITHVIKILSDDILNILRLPVDRVCVDFDDLMLRGDLTLEADIMSILRSMIDSNYPRLIVIKYQSTGSYELSSHPAHHWRDNYINHHRELIDDLLSHMTNQLLTNSKNDGICPL